MPERPLALAVAQPSVDPTDLAATVAHHADAVARARARVVAFPELSLTGYRFDAPPIDPDDPALEPLAETCAATGSIALVGAPVVGPAGAGRSIGVLAIDGNGAAVVYRKMWPGDAEVAAGFVAGADPAVVDVDGWRLGLAVCRDTGITAHAVVTAELGIDVYIAGLVHHDHEVDEQERRAARITAEHGVWVAFAAFAGPTGEGYDRTAGQSAIWSPGGGRVASAGLSTDEVVTAHLTP